MVKISSVIMWQLMCLVVSVTAFRTEDPPETRWSPAPQGGLDGNLVRVHVLFRHGHRVPRTSYPTDPNRNASLWDDGLGQLTGLGRRQGYSFGSGLRRRYGMLLPEVRAWNTIKTQSSQISRTMMTAGVVLAGLVPPIGTDRWSNLDWQPVPIYTRAAELDTTLYGALPCPKLKHFLNEPDYPTEEEKDLREYLEENSGKRVHTLNAVEKLFTCMEIEKQVGLPLPTWSEKVFPEPMRTEAGRALGRSSSTLEAARLRAGPLLEELSDFDLNQVGEPVRLYATHDSVLAGLMGALGLYSGKPPGFVAAFALEYRVNGDKEVHVQLWWREGAGDAMKLLRLPGCSERCPLPQFRSIVEGLIPKDWYRECELTVPWYQNLNGIGIGWWITLTSAFIISIVLVILHGCETTRRHEYEVLPKVVNSFYTF